MKLKPAWTGLAGLALGAAAFWFSFRNVDLAKVAQLCLGIGPVIVTVLLPYMTSITFDTVAWRGILAELGGHGRFFTLWRIRLVTEAVLMAAPAGAFVSETVKPMLVVRATNIPMPLVLASLPLRRGFIFFSHGLFFITAAAIAWSQYDQVSQSVLGNGVLPWAVLAAGLAFVIGGFGLSVLLGTAGLGEKLRGALKILPSARLRAWLDQAASGFLRFDEHLANFLGRGHTGAKLGAVGLFLVNWLLDSAETFLILSLLGSGLSYPGALAAEAGTSILRSLFFIVPAGLGVQEFGYVTILTALGVPDPVNTGASFALIKRGKELFWVTVGLTLVGSATKGSMGERTNADTSRPEAESPVDLRVH